MSLSKTLRSICLPIILALLGGCASFEKNAVARVEHLPDVSHYQHKPSVYIDFRFFRGNPNDSKAVEISQARTQLLPTVEKAIKNSELFSSYTFDEFQKEKVDYTIRLYSYNNGDVGAAAVMGFLCGFTFGVIPAAATDHYVLSTQAIDNQGGKAEGLQSKDSVTTWIGLWFIPMMGNTPQEAVSNTLENQVRDALKNLVENGTLKYSGNRWIGVPYRA